MKKDKLSPFFFVGLCLLILGSIILYQHLSFLGDAQKVTGVISNMIGVSDFDESRTDVYVTYEYKEKLYKDILLNEYHAGMNKEKKSRYIVILIIQQLFVQKVEVTFHQSLLCLLDVS